MTAIAAEDRLLDHADEPAWRGRLSEPTLFLSGRNPLCGDQIRLELRLKGDRIAEAKFEGQGCLVSQACASMLCEGIAGRTIEELLAIPAGDLLEFDVSQLTVNRRHCALLAHGLLRRMLDEDGRH